MVPAGELLRRWVSDGRWGCGRGGHWDLSLGDIVEATGTGFLVFVEIDLDWYYFSIDVVEEIGSDTISANDALPRIGYVFI
jgi:hypothetical protein